jgi:hypothetical protein
VLLLLLLAVAVAAPAGAQTTDPATQSALQAAQGSIATGDFAAARDVLVEVTADHPDNGLAWALLGYSLRGLEDFPAAVAAYEKAVPLRPEAGGTLLQGGMAQAQAGNLDRAFEWLARAKAAGMDVTAVDLDPAGEVLRDDPRYVALFPSAAAYDDPFVEPARILREWRGEGKGDQFGWIARDIGDVDGDGLHDVVTSAPTWGSQPDGSAAGKVYAYSSGSGALLWSADGHPGDQLGLGVEAAGDVDGDGTPDVLAGAPYGDRAVVFSGRDGTVLFDIPAQQSGEAFGQHVADLGDVNGDGHADFVVGAPLNDAAGQDAGRAYVLSGADGSVLLTLTGEEAGDRFGSTSGGGMRDGRMTLIVGAPNAGEGDRGRVYVYRQLTGQPSFVIDSDPEGAQLGGMFVSAVGDVDGDGVTDVYASDWPGNGKDGLQGAGRLYVHSGADGHRLYTLTGEAAGDGFGIGVADAGDVDGDGHADLVIGAWQNHEAAASGGKVYLYAGADGSLLRTLTGKVMGESLGFDATGVGDVDGDGVIDLLLTSAWSAVRGAHSGRMFIVAGTRAAGSAGG